MMEKNKYNICATIELRETQLRWKVISCDKNEVKPLNIKINELVVIF